MVNALPIILAVVIVTVAIMALIVLSFFCCCCGLYMMQPSSKISDPLPIMRRLLPPNYTIETHTCTTPDGYNLTLTRIFNPDKLQEKSKNPILL